MDKILFVNKIYFKKIYAIELYVCNKSVFKYDYDLCILTSAPIWNQLAGAL